MARSLKDVIDETIENIISNGPMISLIEREIGPAAIAAINAHVTQGRYMSGDYKDKGYSESTLPAFYLGDIQKNGDAWQIRSNTFNVTVSPRDDFIWRWDDEDAKPRAYLVGGYKNFRRLAGRQTSIVKLTFTGQMLNSLDFSYSITGRKAQVKVGATGGQQNKAYYTDLQREWLVLFEDEQQTIVRNAENFIARQLDRLPDVSID